jgi:hypothetical protein
LELDKATGEKLRDLLLFYTPHIGVPGIIDRIIKP